ncbi:MAG TPA: histidine kinase [Flavobacteriia bacterium]|nr:histidine kinase [Flavobacteriia bacterium]
MKSFFFVAFILINSFSFAQIIDLTREHPYKKVFVETDNFGTAYLDILKQSLPTIQQDTLYFEVLNDLAYYWHTRNLNTSLTFIKKGLELTNQKKDSLWNGRFQITQGAVLLRMEQLDSAELVLEAAKTKVKESDLAFLNTQLGYVYERRGELDKAADYALESLRLGKKLKDTNAQAIAYSDLSNLFWKQSKFDKGVEFGLKSLQFFELRNINNLDYDFTLYVVGNNYLELKQYKRALEYFERSIAIGERYGFYNNLSDVYISLTDLDTYLGNYNTAAEAGKNAVKYAELLDNNFMIMRSWLSIGKSQLKQKQYTNAIISLKKCIQIATVDFGDEYYLSQAYEALAQAYFGNKNFEKAYVALAEHDKLKAAVFTAEADQRISLLQTKFGVALKEDTIKLRDATIKQQRSKQTLIMVIASLLLVLLTVLYVTYRKDKNKTKLLKKQHDEKSFLLKEIHHRVKNNLEVVSSLLALQSNQLQDDAAKNAMQDSQNRVHSMSMIHQRLYQGKNLASIEMKDYCFNLTAHVLDSFGAEEQINVKCNMKPIELDVDTAVPIGLIVNELLTNILKYAFPDNKKGTITITLEKKDRNTLLLQVADNGVGIQEGVIRGTGFGTQLISLLTQQLNGKMKTKTNKNKGTQISFEFPLMV